MRNKSRSTGKGKRSEEANGGEREVSRGHVSAAGAPTASHAAELLQQLQSDDMPAVRIALRALPATLGARGDEIAEARRILCSALDDVIARLTRLDATPPLDLTHSVITHRLSSPPDFARLGREFLDLVDRLRTAMVRAHLAQAYRDEELMPRLKAHAARRLKGTGRSPLGAIHDGIIEVLETERERSTERERERERTTRLQQHAG
jgi:hypothetical protein